jgi:TolA-binding protein
MNGRWILWALLGLLWSARPGWADPVQEEERAFQAAMRSFQGEFWGRAQQEWKDYTIRFPLSARAPEAVLYQAQCLIELGNPAGAIQLLQDGLPQAGSWAGEYVFWMAEAHFRAENYTAAAQGFERVLREFPGAKRALEAALGQAASRARLKQWDKVVAVLQDPAGPLPTTTETPANRLLIVRGHLLLAEAFLALGDYRAARVTIESPQLRDLDASLEWQKEHLQARTLMALGLLPEALAASSNLVATARGPGQKGLLAEANLFQAQVLAELGRLDEAVSAYRQNLSTNTPPAVQRQTLLRLSSLLIRNQRFAEGRAVIEQFAQVSPDPATADLARVTIAELKLRQHLQVVASGKSESTPTNLLEQVIGDLDEVIQSGSNRRLQGQAYLWRGWAEWIRGDQGQAGDAFAQACQILPRSEEQAIARFKWADAQMMSGEYAEALSNYQAVVAMAPGLGGAATELVEPALYQTLRAGLELDRPDLATNALSQLLEAYPNRFLTGVGVLLTGQGFTELGDPAAARGLFQRFLERAPDSPLAAEIQLAVARTIEAEGDWSGAIRQYESILATHKERSPIRARAEYFRALDTALSGLETNALVYFTNFVAAHPTNSLAARAQWWIADHYWRQQDYVNAELNYQLVFKNWPASDLAYEARMMAGRAAMARLSLSDAIGYFTNLTSDLSCPPELKPKAMFAYGDALMRLPSGNTNDPLANYAEAIKVFSSIERNYPSNGLAALAQGMIGNCYLQLAGADPRAFESATNAYSRVLTNAEASVAARSQAEVGLATVLEKLALRQEGEARTSLLQAALDRHLNVFLEKNLRPGEASDPFWVRKSGLEAGRLAETLQLWPQALKLYERLQALVPSLEPLLQNKILKSRELASRAGT